jgi:hypothetical protein
MILGTAQAPLLSSDGNFGDVFALGSDRAVKVLRRLKVTERPVEREDDHWVVLRALWDAECSAYELLRKDPELAAYIPDNFARVTVDDIVREDGASIADNYLLDCAFVMDRIFGHAEKLAHLYGTPAFDPIDQIVDKMIDAGVRSAADGSVFVPGKNAPFTIIDIATWEAIAELSDVLAKTGRLPEHVRARWGRPTAA